MFSEFVFTEEDFFLQTSWFTTSHFFLEWDQLSSCCSRITTGFLPLCHHLLVPQVCHMQGVFVPSLQFFVWVFFLHLTLIFWFLYYWPCMFFKLQMKLVLFETPNTFKHLTLVFYQVSHFLEFLSLSSWLVGSAKTIDFRTSSSSMFMWFIGNLFGG